MRKRYIQSLVASGKVVCVTLMIMTNVAGVLEPKRNPDEEDEATKEKERGNLRGRTAREELPHASQRKRVKNKGISHVKCYEDAAKQEQF